MIVKFLIVLKKTSYTHTHSYKTTCAYHTHVATNVLQFYEPNHLLHPPIPALEI